MRLNKTRKKKRKILSLIPNINFVFFINLKEAPLLSPPPAYLRDLLAWIEKWERYFISL